MTEPEGGGNPRRERSAAEVLEDFGQVLALELEVVVAGEDQDQAAGQGGAAAQGHVGGGDVGLVA